MYWLLMQHFMMNFSQLFSWRFRKIIRNNAHSNFYFKIAKTKSKCKFVQRLYVTKTFKILCFSSWLLVNVMVICNYIWLQVVISVVFENLYVFSITIYSITFYLRIFFFLLKILVQNRCRPWCYMRDLCHRKLFGTFSPS